MVAHSSEGMLEDGGGGRTQQRGDARGWLRLVQEDGGPDRTLVILCPHLHEHISSMA